ncbi:hypothetical protein CBM2609_A100404 [Cupriavidus taiwanensis]|nr:hypothetical protein CBM2604_A80401 [Cupriavidus taiwanensis]SOZ22699.1 hypothetical protein CBM2609_A100404 [Cupriavidus taiwanensis]SOZ42427.1 hypothetical protein CBM2610_A100400 [Cupriavidus taiwanensis]
MTRTSHPRTQHSIAFYRAVLTLLIDSVRQGLTHRRIAALLNDSRLPAPSGAAWSTNSVRVALHKLRWPDTHPSKLFQALTRLHYMGLLSKDDCQVLTAHKGYTEVLL